MASLELKKVAKSYDGKHQVVHGIDLEIQHGEFVVFVGPSGYGKSLEGNASALQSAGPLAFSAPFAELIGTAPRNCGNCAPQ